ncbi:MAG TPA: c-type cytochrome [Thermoanaerobaculia bacterium]|nr:c-type cytochrome [Thermoanaerobaculia bacterium]
MTCEVECRHVLTIAERLRHGVRELGFVVAVLVVAACNGDDERIAQQIAGGNPQRGREVIARYGCGACHEIPGLPVGRGLVGPSLERIADRSHLAGRLENEPANLVRWIREPQKISPGTAMPNLNVSERDAKDIAAYLYTARGRWWW